MTLDQVLIGHTVMILNVTGQGMLRKRLLEMGMTPHTKVKVIKVAPLGDPIEVFLRCYTLTLRKKEASQIIVQEVINE